eukprot:3818906-Prymnesium_polylepis.2
MMGRPGSQRVKCNRERENSGAGSRRQRGRRGTAGAGGTCDRIGRVVREERLTGVQADRAQVRLADCACASEDECLPQLCAGALRSDDVPPTAKAATQCRGASSISGRRWRLLRTEWRVRSALAHALPDKMFPFSVPWRGALQGAASACCRVRRVRARRV